jgi:hypothetical protein
MKIKDLLAEGMTFTPARLVVDSNGKKYIDGTEFEQAIEKDCPSCEGTGKDYWSDGEEYPCRYCENSPGKYKSYESTVPTLQVSNSNGGDILEWLGIEHDYVGYIPPEKLPAIMTKLIKINNTENEISKFTTDTTKTKNTYVDRSDPDVPSIKSGPAMYNIGRSYNQVERYVDSLIKIIKTAQELGIGIAWS